MRLAVLVFSAISGSAVAAECPEGSAEIFKLTAWSANAIQTSAGSRPGLQITYENASQSDVRMIDAVVRFDDALGSTIGSVALERDIRLLSSGSHTAEFRLPLTSRLGRLSSLEEGDVNGFICTRAVLYEDGTREDF